MNNDSTLWDRRAFLGTSAGLVVTGFAGCLNNQQNQGTSSGGSGDGETQLDFVGGRAPTEIQFNRWNQSNFGHTYSTLFWTGLATAYSDGTIKSDFLEDISVDGNQLTVTFPQDWTYWNGKDLTAKDYYIGVEIDRLQDPEASNYENHELVDEYTVTHTFKEAVTPTLMRASLIDMGVNTPRWIFEEYLTRYQDASGEDERESITEELLKKTISMETFVEEGLGNGLYEVESFSASETIVSKFEDHPYADRTDVDKCRIVPVGDTTDQLATSDKLDMTLFGYIKDSAQYPGNIENLMELQWFRTQKFILNWTNEHLGKRPVRRALVSALDLEAITQSAVDAAYTAEPTQVQTGLRSSIHDKYLGEEFVDSLISYPVAGDSKTATEYMEQADYAKENGTWTSPDGTTMSLTILTRDNAGQAEPSKVLRDQLQQFGIETEVNAVGDNYYTKLQEYEFDLGWVWHVAKALWHPTAYFSNDFYGVLAGDPDSGNETGPTGVPFETTIPNTVGDKQVSGGGTTIKPAELMNQLPVSTSKEQVTERTKTLVQWFNYDLPAIVYMQENSGYWGDVANFSFPDGSGEKKMDANNPGQHAWMRGWITQ
ncbi:ABC transporter substrate-binding protein [Halocatena halophila]|uniref:ABC transporter substrate-binding protein n=1 Tax=Halocatena halophila TaxID=2814576 RepID=UPI002ED346DE